MLLMKGLCAMHISRVKLNISTLELKNINFSENVTTIPPKYSSNKIPLDLQTKT